MGFSIVPPKQPVYLLVAAQVPEPPTTFLLNVPSETIFVSALIRQLPEQSLELLHTFPASAYR